MATTIYEDLENATLAALAPMAAGGLVEVVLFSDDNSQVKSAFVKPRISVSYHSFTGGDTLDINASSSDKAINIQVMFEAKKTRGPLGIYDLEARAEAILNGLKLPNYKRFTIGQFNRNERDPDGVWVYNLILKVVGMSAQAFDDNTPALAVNGLSAALAALPLKLSRLIIIKGAELDICLVYNKALNALSTPQPSDFYVPYKTITSVEIFGRAVTISINSAFVSGENRIVTYKPGVSPIMDTDGNLADGFLGQYISI